MFARQSLSAIRVSRNQIVSKRFVHIENTVGNNTPFDYTTSPKMFGFKMFLLYGGGFSLPFIVAAYQIRKASA